MKARQVRNSLWIFSIAALVTAPLGWRVAASESGRTILPLTSGARELRRTSTDSLEKMAAQIAAHDPFRLDHHPASVPYRPELDGVAVAAPPPPPKPPKPHLAVAGILGGPPWTALLDSVPGRDGSVLVKRGDTLGGLKIRSVGRDTVVVQGTDTLWKLVVKRPWQ
jgi:hypothetical protein